MKVKCVAVSLEEIVDVDARERLVASINQEGADSYLQVGAVYSVVSLVRWRDQGFRVYLHVVEESDYPYPYPLEMFEVVDPALPSGWVASFRPSKGRTDLHQIGPASWCEEFYERLVDGEELAILSYQEMRGH